MPESLQQGAARPSASPAEQKSRALTLIMSAWDTATAEGIGAELMASTAIFSALAEMVDVYGQDAVAKFCASLPERVLAGEFTLRPPE